MSENQLRVLRFLVHSADFVMPRIVGETVAGKPYQQSSAWGSRVCRQLVALGYAERNEKGHYTYTEAGYAELVARGDVP